MPNDPDAPLTPEEKAFYGHDARRSRISGLPLQQGSGALHEFAQVRDHLAVIRQTEGEDAAITVAAKLAAAERAAAETMRAKLEAAGRVEGGNAA